MTLEPAYELTVGNQRWTAQAVTIVLELAPAPSLNVLTVGFPARAPLDAGPDDDVSLVLDGGEGAETVFTGTVESIARTDRTITLRALDGGGALAAFRPAVTFEQATAGSVIQGLCDDAGVATGSIEDGPTLTYYAADPSRTALDHVARVAGWGGATAVVDGDGHLSSRVVDGSQPELALRFGREPVALRQQRSASRTQAFTVAGEAGASTPSAPEAVRPTTDFFAGDRPEGPSASVRWSFEPALRTPEVAATAGAAQGRLYASARHRSDLTAWLLPVLRPGTVLSFEDVPDGLARGPFWVERVRHSLHPADGGVTRARLSEGGESFGPGSLLAGLAGAIGGLL